MRKSRKTWGGLCCASFLILSACSQNSPQDKTSAQATGENYTIAELNLGEASYKTHCVSCHGQNLEGAAGVNLADSEWLYGDTIANISHNISSGFPDSGMPGFAELLSDDEMSSVAKFIRSKRQGWDYVDYKIYPVAEGSAPDFSIVNSSKPVVSGRFKNGLADFERIEVPNFIVVLEGPLSVPWPEPTALLFEEAGWTNANQKTELQIEINDEPVVPVDPSGWDWVIPLERGSQTLKIAYFVSGPIKADEPWTMWHKSSARAYIIRSEGYPKLAPLSRRAKIEMEDSLIEVEIGELPQVVRIKTIELPAYSVNVGLTNNMSYAFNTRSCDIVGLWEGDFLNIGPNVIGRGKGAGQPMGDWAFHHPDVLSVTHDTDRDCRFKKYTRGESPAFYFTKDGTDFRISGHAQDTGVKFEVGVKGGSTEPSVNMALPDIENYSVTKTDASHTTSDNYTIVQTILIEKL